jgi:hypothetical protein
LKSKNNLILHRKIIKEPNIKCLNFRPIFVEASYKYLIFDEGIKESLTSVAESIEGVSGRIMYELMS